MVLSPLTTHINSVQVVVFDTTVLTCSVSQYFTSPNVLFFFPSICSAHAVAAASPTVCALEARGGISLYVCVCVFMCLNGSPLSATR